MRMNNASRLLAVIVSAIASTGLTAQTTAQATAQTTTPPAEEATAEDLVVLSPFVVDGSQDSGYRAQNTLAGSRLNTSLRDTASSVSVFTEEFLADLGINQLEEMVGYTVSASVGTQDTNAAPNANASINGQRVISEINIRGIGSSQAVDYFKSITPNDSYRISRYDESRGPNGILFGISSAGGMINQSSIMATTARDSGRISYQMVGGATEGGRFEFRTNQVIVPKKLALAISAVDQEFDGWRKPDYRDKRRLFGTLTFEPTDRITIRLSGETGNELGSRVAPYGISDGLLGWLDNRNAYGLDAVTYTPTGSNPTTAQRAQGIVLRNQALNNNIPGSKRFIYVENDSSFFNSGGTLLTGSYNDSTVKSPTGEPSVAVSNSDPMRLNLPGYIPYGLNSGGPGMYRDQDFDNYTFQADWRVTKKLNVSFAHNHQSTDLVSPVITGAQPMLSADPNRTRGVGGPANPYVGQFYIDATWRNGIHTASYEESRATLSYDFSFKPDWLGTHRLAVMGSISHDEDYYNDQSFGVLGSVFSTTADDATNRITHRIYLDEHNPASFMAAHWRSFPETVTFGGVTYDTGWINSTSSTGNSTAEQDSDAFLTVLQSRFWKDRIITTFGYREDNAEITSYGLKIDPTTKMTVTDLDPAKATVNDVRGITRTQGVVFHATNWLSLIGNWSTNIGIPQFENKVLPTGQIPNPSEGEGLDYGIALNLLENRVFMKAVYFETSSTGNTGSGGIASRYDAPNIRIANSLETVLVGAGLPYTAEQWAPIRSSITVPVTAQTFDQDSEGYEFTATANMTPNWRVTATYSYTDRIRANTGGVDVIPWYGFTYDGKFVKQGVTTVGSTTTIDSSAFTPDGTVARWMELAAEAGVDLNTFASAGSNPPRTVAVEIQTIINDLNDDKEVNEQRWGLRPHRASLFTAYDFKEGRVKGLTVGGGARWSSANINGTRADGSEIYGRPLTSIDLLLRYTHKVPGLLGGAMSYQVNVYNLLDQDGIVPQRYVDPKNPDYQLPGGRGAAYTRFEFVTPRSVSFTATYSF